MPPPTNWPPVLQADTLTYTPSNGIPATRPMTVWRTGSRHVTVLLTELGDGMSITNAIHHVHFALQAMWPADAIRLIEYYPQASGCVPDHLDEAHLTPSGQWAWRRLSREALLAELGPTLPPATTPSTPSESETR
jgi:hypothetical protein